MGKSEIMNTLKPAERDAGGHKNQGKDLIQLGKIRGVRVQQEVQEGEGHSAQKGKLHPVVPVDLPSSTAVVKEELPFQH